jgi:hypothetical protein
VILRFALTRTERNFIERAVRALVTSEGDSQTARDVLHMLRHAEVTKDSRDFMEWKR